MKTNNNNETKFLIIRLSSLGDIVLATPLIRCIKNDFPKSTIDFIVKKQFADILKNNPYINNILEYDKHDTTSISKIRSRIINQNYYIIDLQNNITSRRIRKNAGKYTAKFNKKLWQKIMLVWLKKNLFDNKTIPERYIETANTFNIKNDAKGLEIWLPEEKIYTESTAIVVDNKPLTISIAPAATHQTKQWLPEYFITLIHKLNKKYNCQFNLLGGNDAIEICQFITNNLNAKIENYAGKTSIQDVTNILSKSNVLISNDTGIMHIGAARHVPILAIFGSTTKEFGFVPYKTPHQICEVQLPCRPCSHIGRQNCPKKHFNCMKLLKPDTVFYQFENLLSLK